MTMMRFLCAFALLAGAVLTQPARADDKTPLGLLQEIYRNYERSDKGVDIASREKAGRYFTPEIADLIDQDVKESAKRNEVGKLDFDPFIGGQDWRRTKIALKAAPGPKPDRATGTASFTPAGEKKRTTVTLDLVKIAPGWRIADIHWQGQSDSLLKILSAKE